MARKNIKSADVRNRRLILDILKTDGAQDASTLAQTLGMSPMGARQHLYRLEEEGLVASTDEPRPRGRPARLWALTAAADRYFPDAHAALTVELVNAMAATLDPDQMAAVLKVRSQGQKASYTVEMAAASTLDTRLEKLAEIRTREGYMCGVETADDGTTLLVEKHCPICIAATSCTGLCETELELFRDLLGPGIAVDRTDHMISGATRCVYRITETSDISPD